MNGFALSEMDRQIAGLIVPGAVAAVDVAGAMVRIESDDWVSGWVPWLSFAAGKARHWRAPSVGEQAVLLCPSGEPDNGFALVGFYTDGYGHDTRPDVVAWEMPDGSKIEYDFAAGAAIVEGCKTVSVRASNSVFVEGTESVTVKSTKITLDADDVMVTKNLTVGAAINHLAQDGKPANFGGGISAAGGIHSDADVTAGKISLGGHSHLEQGDGALVSQPR